VDYRIPGELTALDGVDPGALAGLGPGPVEVCWPVHGLVIQPGDAERLGLPADRMGENQIRPAAHLVATLLRMVPEPLSELREPAQRVVGTCRHFALLSCALLRHRGIAARARCGFATYFQPGQALDHWITEYRRDGRWVRIDSEILGGSVLTDPAELTPGQFLSGGEAWLAYRSGQVDAATFGVPGTTNFGPAEIRGNAVKDLAALNKVEMLPWDEWGRMPDMYAGRTGPDYDLLIDRIAAVCAEDDPAEVAALYATEDLAVPAALLDVC
jgi:Transglutaminase-like superfamily